VGTAPWPPKIGVIAVPAPLPTLQIQHVFSARLLKTVTICLMAFKQLSR
jgi:hypothetical protein